MQPFRQHHVARISSRDPDKRGDIVSLICTRNVPVQLVCKISSRNYRAGQSSRIREIPVAVLSHHYRARFIYLADDTRLLPSGGRPRAGCATGGLQSLPGTAALWTQLRPRQGRGRLHGVRLSDAAAALLSADERHRPGRG